MVSSSRKNKGVRRNQADIIGRHAVNKGSFFVPFPVNLVFPLYGPAEEAKWARGWEPHWLYPERSLAETSSPERGWVFTTGNDPAEKKLWYLQEVDLSSHKISYIVHWPGRMIYRIDVSAASSLDPTSKRIGTSTTVIYDYVGTSAAGNREVERRTGRPERYAEEMEHWHHAIQAYLERNDR